MENMYLANVRQVSDLVREEDLDVKYDLQMSDRYIADKKYCNVDPRSRQREVLLENTTCINVTVDGLTIGGFINGCTFINCRFINCGFIDVGIVNSKFVNCYIEKCMFDNNTQIIGNSFERMTGSIDGCSIIRFDNNSFYDMDFSGFLPFYLQGRGGNIENGFEIRWCRNHFRGVTLPVEKLKDVCTITNHIGGASAHGAKNLTYSMFCSSESGNHYEQPFIEPAMQWEEKVPMERLRKHVRHEDPTISIDLDNLTPSQKEWIAASIFTTYPIADSYMTFDSNNELIISESGQKIYTVDLPNPITIVDNRGYFLDTSRIPKLEYIYPYELSANRQSTLPPAIRLRLNSCFQPIDMSGAYSCKSLTLLKKENKLAKDTSDKGLK